MAFINWEYTVNFWKRALGLGSSPAKKVAKLKPKEKLSGVEKEPSPTATTENRFKVFDPELILTDEEFLDCDSMSEKDIQDFLVSKGGVILPDTKINGHLVSYWMHKHCVTHGLNPKVLMTHMQKEMGAVTRKTPYKKQRTYDYILGVGATDGGDNAKWAGIDKQIEGAVLTCVKWHKRGMAETFPLHYNASDRKDMRLKNAASYSLYKYTPWVGDSDKKIGKNLYRSPFGNYLFWKVYKGFFGK